ncbi:hypothetical protein [Psychrobacter sp. 72-O-c]|uniref:hypothetical protein n=1 Tax=Psychrobacter sp. 72-O-c TaxID=2774125 RepID=UPI00191B2E85|nr:hypothetical protein [Psychrobacter sp. 72-O-c]
MSQVMFATRLPESKRRYIQYKAMHTGKQQQELMAEIIDFYQQHDSEFMQLFASLSAPTDTTSSDKEISDDA